MPRARGGYKTRRRRKGVLKLAKGQRGGRSKLYRVARASAHRALAYAFAGRKIKKRDYRSLWILRINAGARSIGTTYSKLMSAFKKSGIEIDRKNLSHLAVNDMNAFTTIAKKAGL